jgi:hypothetical protein
LAWRGRDCEVPERLPRPLLHRHDRPRIRPLVRGKRGVKPPPSPPFQHCISPVQLTGVPVGSILLGIFDGSGGCVAG